MPKYLFTLSIGIHNASQEDFYEIEDDEIENMTEEEVEQYLERCWSDWSNNYIDGGFELVKE